MDTPEDPLPTQDLSGIVGHRLIYTYTSGWRYEMYVKNARTIDYRVHSGMVGGRWVKDQAVDLVRLADDVYKVSWNEPTGTCVVVNLLPARRVVHGTIFFPRWIQLDAGRTAVFQNEHLEEMRALRDAGPTYPIEVLPYFARITLIERVGENDEDVISAAPADLPPGFADRTVGDPVVVPADAGRAFPGPTGRPMTVKLGADDTQGAYSLIEYTHAPHAPGPPPHVHHEHEEAFHVTAGELTLDVDGSTLSLGPGDYALVPRGAVHRPYNTGDMPVTFFFIASPAMDGFFAEMADLNAATGGSPSPEQLREIGERWDSEFTHLPAANGVRMVDEE